MAVGDLELRVQGEKKRELKHRPVIPQIKKKKNLGRGGCKHYLRTHKFRRKLISSNTDFSMC